MKNTKAAIIPDNDFRILADLLPDNIARYDKDGKIRYMNQKLRDGLGLSLEQIVGKHPSEIWPNGEFEIFAQKIHAVLKSGKSDELELNGTQYNGNTEYHHIVYAPEINEAGEVIGVVAFGRDLTQRILLEQKLTAGARMASLGEMAGGIAHEINTPLASIMLLSEQIDGLIKINELNPAQLLKISEKINNTAIRIANIVKGLRSFSRDASDDPFQIVHVGKVIEETASFCFERFKNNYVNLKIKEIDPRLTFEVRELQLSQVLLNLLNNSFDAILNLPEKWIEISVKDQQDFVEIYVTDSGKGIDIAIQNKIFDPFFTTKDIGKGTGLGLSISFGIIQNHQGKMAVDNKNPNTSFVISLPKKQKK